MNTVTLSQAKSDLARLRKPVENGDDQEIVITRSGRPAARLVQVADAPVGQRIGVAKGKFVVPDDIDQHNDEVAQLFSVGTAP